MTDQDRASPLDYLSIGKDVVSMIGAGVAVCYALGFLIVNVRLLKYQVYQPDLVSVKYLTSGIVFILIAAPPALLIVREARRVVTRSSRASLRKELPGYVKASCQSALLAVAMVCVVSYVGWGLWTRVTSWLDWMKHLVISATKWSAISVLPAGIVLAEAAAEWRTRRSLSFWVLIGGTFMCAAVLVGYATYVYDLLPPPVGGAPVVARLLLHPDYAHDYELLGIPLQDGNLSAGLCLLEQTDRVYIVSILEDKFCTRGVMEIDRAGVLGVLYPRRRVGW